MQMLTVVKNDYPRGASQLLDELDGFRVVLFLYNLVVLERLVLCRAAEVLEASGVEGELVFAPACVVYDDRTRIVSQVVLGLAGGRGEVYVSVRLL